MKDNTLQTALSREELVSQLKHLGITADMTLEVHCSLRSVGYIIGGAGSFVDALLEVLSQGTLVMACQNVDNSEPLNWVNPPIALNLTDKVRENMPAYDIYHSDVHFMGALALDLRCRKQTCRSYHPNCAFIANGKDGRELMARQPLNFPLGHGSPLEKLYNNDNAWIMLVGVDYDRATGLHYAESISEIRPIVLQGGAVNVNGRTEWKKYLDYDLDCDDFPELGRQMERRKMVRIGKIGSAQVKLFNFRQASDFALEYFRNL